MSADPRGHVEDRATNDRLGDLKLSQDTLRQALEWGWRQSLDCTMNDPPILRGLIVWGRTVRRLRELLAPAGWKVDNSNNYSTVESPDGRTRIAVAAGDEDTGCTEGSPCTKSPKGPSTKDAVHRNQMSLFADFLDNFPAPDRSIMAQERRLTWLLLHYVDEQASETRLELALPAHMDDHGRVTKWQERIILDPIPHLPAAPDIELEASDVEVQVERRDAETLPNG